MTWAALLAASAGAFVGMAIMIWSLAAAGRAERHWWLGLADALEDADSYCRACGADAPADLVQAAEAVRAGMGQVSPLPALLELGRRRFEWSDAAASALLALVCGALAWRSPTAGMAALWVGFACGLAAAAVVDARFMILPDVLTLSLMWAALAASAAGWLGDLTPARSIAGAIAGYAGLWVLATVYGLASGKQAMGHGDFKLLAAVGAWFGPHALVPVAVLAFATAAVVGFLSILRDPTCSRMIPFGPHLCAASIVVALVGPKAAGAIVF